MLPRHIVASRSDFPQWWPPQHQFDVTGPGEVCQIGLTARELGVGDRCITNQSSKVGSQVIGDRGFVEALLCPDRRDIPNHDAGSTAPRLASSVLDTSGVRRLLTNHTNAIAPITATDKPVS